MPTTWNWRSGRESGYAYEQIKESKMTTKQLTKEMIFEKWKPITDAHINFPILPESCPIQDGDYQYPMPKEMDDGLGEKER